MIVPDVNLLLYAYDSTSPFHSRAVTWWSSCLSGDEAVGLLAPVVFGFVRISTSPRAFAAPLGIDDAAAHVRSWLAQPPAEFLEMTDDDVLVALELLERAGTGGNLTTDAQVAAVARRHRAVVHTADPDFARFTGVRWIHPLR